VTVELSHEALAECHDFSVALPLGIEISAAFAAADRKTGQAVLEALLETEELDDAEFTEGWKRRPPL
jgi:hypothetical protein